MFPFQPRWAMEGGGCFLFCLGWFCGFRDSLLSEVCGYGLQFLICLRALELLILLIRSRNFPLEEVFFWNLSRRVSFWYWSLSLCSEVSTSYHTSENQPLRGTFETDWNQLFLPPL